MALLPFAPPPEIGEALSSWIARLAAFNFVSTAEFWAWLGYHPDNDIDPQPGFFQRLAEISGTPARSFSRKFALSGPREATLAQSFPSGIRGGACAQCCWEGLTTNRSHFTHKVATAAFRVTCPIHRRRLISLAGCTVELRDGYVCFAQGKPPVPLGENGKYLPKPGKLILQMEDALTRVVRGKSPGVGWRTDDPTIFSACVTSLIDVVLWRGLKGTFAAGFDDINYGGGAIYFIRADSQSTGHLTLTEQNPATRLHVVSALATLLVDPASQLRITTAENSFRLATDGDPFTNLADSLRSAQISVLAERLKTWPQCIARPMVSGILDTHGL